MKSVERFLRSLERALRARRLDKAERLVFDAVVRRRLGRHELPSDDVGALLVRRVGRHVESGARDMLSSVVCAVGVRMFDDLAADYDGVIARLSIALDGLLPSTGSTSEQLLTATLRAIEVRRESPQLVADAVRLAATMQAPLEASRWRSMAGVDNAGALAGALEGAVLSDPGNVARVFFGADELETQQDHLASVVLSLIPRLREVRGDRFVEDVLLSLPRDSNMRVRRLLRESRSMYGLPVLEPIYSDAVAAPGLPDAAVLESLRGAATIAAALDLLGEDDLTNERLLDHLYSRASLEPLAEAEVVFNLVCTLLMVRSGMVGFVQRAIDLMSATLSPTDVGAVEREFWRQLQEQGIKHLANQSINTPHRRLMLRLAGRVLEDGVFEVERKAFLIRRLLPDDPSRDDLAWLSTLDEARPLVIDRYSSGLDDDCRRRILRMVLQDRSLHWLRDALVLDDAAMPSVTSDESDAKSSMGRMTAASPGFRNRAHEARQ